jgi:hypothetical protein
VDLLFTFFLLFLELFEDLFVERVPFDLKLLRVVHIKQELTTMVRVLSDKLIGFFEAPNLFPHVFSVGVARHWMDPTVLRRCLNGLVWGSWRDVVSN